MSEGGLGGRVENEHELPTEYEKLLEQFGAFVASANERSRNNRVSNVRAWMRWCDETGRDIDSVEKPDLLNHIDELFLTDDDNKMAHTSIGSRIDSISRFYIWANGRAHLTANPVEKFSFQEDYPQLDPNVSQKYLVLRKQNPEDESKAILSIPQERIERIAEHASSDRDELVIRLFQQTGIRASEMEGIKFEHINWDDRSILIYTAKAKPKDENYTRRVYWHPNLDYLFEEWRIKRKQYTTRDSEYLFNNIVTSRTSRGSAA